MFVRHTHLNSTQQAFSLLELLLSIFIIVYLSSYSLRLWSLVHENEQFVQQALSVMTCLEWRASGAVQACDSGITVSQQRDGHRLRWMAHDPTRKHRWQIERFNA